MANVLNITRKEFAQNAQALPVKIGEQTFLAAPRTFSGQGGKPGSVGFYDGGKMVVMIGGKPVKCQVGLNITVIGSKELPVEA